MASNPTSRLPANNFKKPTMKSSVNGPTKNAPPRRILGDITQQNVNAKTMTKPLVGKTSLSKTALAKPRLTRIAARRSCLPPSKVEVPVLVDNTDTVERLVLPPGVVDIDSRADTRNPQLCAEYAQEIFVYLRSLEPRGMVRENHLLGCPTNEKMRAVLVDWLIEVQLEFRLLQETLFITIDILDRYLAKEGQRITRDELQLVGVSAMFVSAKMEEVYSPDVQDFVLITDNAYTEADIKETELKILCALQFNLFQPISLHFLRRFSAAGDVDVYQHNLAKYALEVGLLDYSLVCVPGSLLAASALYLSLLVLNDSESCNEVWTPSLVYYCNYTRKEILPTSVKLAGAILKIHQRECRTQAVKNKYKSSKFMKVADLPEVKGESLRKLANLKILPLEKSPIEETQRYNTTTSI